MCVIVGINPINIFSKGKKHFPGREKAFISCRRKYYKYRPDKSFIFP